MYLWFEVFDDSIVSKGICPTNAQQIKKQTVQRPARPKLLLLPFKYTARIQKSQINSAYYQVEKKFFLDNASKLVSNVISYLDEKPFAHIYTHYSLSWIDRIFVHVQTIQSSPGLDTGLDNYGQRQRGQFQFAAGERSLQLRGQAGDVHRSRAFRHHIRRGHHWERHARVDIRPAQAHAKRAEHLHTQLGTRRPVGDHQLRAVHVHRVHGKNQWQTGLTESRERSSWAPVFAWAAL